MRQLANLVVKVIEKTSSLRKIGIVLFVALLLTDSAPLPAHAQDATPEEQALSRIEEAARTGATQLWLDGLDLQSLPPELWELTHLEWLTLSGNQLTELPPEIVRLGNLKTLYISRNQIAQLPPELWEMRSLEILSLASNQFTQMPPELWDFTNLTTLDLGGNQLNELPPEIGQLTNLTWLGLISCELTELPPEIGQLSNLEWLYLSSNQFSGVPPEIWPLVKMKWLLLEDLQLTELPSEIGLFTELEYLTLSRNQLSYLPPEIGSLSNLKTLNVSYSQLTVLPPEIGQLTNLENLVVSNSPLTEIPPEIGELANLTSLNLAINQLTALPPEIGGLSNLTSLSAPGNNLSELPPEIGQLTSLEALWLSDNQLIDLPSEIGQLTNLETLNLSGNLLAELPSEIDELPNLETLNVDDNPIDEAETTGTTVENAPQYHLDYGDVASGELSQSSSLYIYTFNGQMGDHIRIVMSAGGELDTHLLLHDGNGNVIAENDNHDNVSTNLWELDSAIELILPRDDEYTIFATVSSEALQSGLDGRSAFVLGIEIVSHDNSSVSVASNCEGAPLSQLSPGGRARVTFTDGSPTALREAPRFGAGVLTNMPEGFEFDVISGPTCASSFAWWQLQLPDGTIGWAPEGDNTSYWIEPLLSDENDIIPLEFAASDTQLLRVTYMQGNEVRSFDLNSGNDSLLLSLDLLQSQLGAIEFCPELSSDGSYLAFTHLFTNSGIVDLAVVDVKTGTLVTTIHDVTKGFDWQPHTSILTYGRGIEFDSSFQPANDDGLWGFYAVTGESREILPSPVGYPLAYPTWSPDGSRVAVHQVTGMELSANDPLIVFEADGSEYYFNEVVGIYSFDWAPDASKIAFSDGIYGNDGQSLYVTDISGENTQWLIGDRQFHAHRPAWSPNGQLIAFFNTIGGYPNWETHLWVINADSGQASQITNFGVYASSRGAWSPDGSRLLVELRDSLPRLIQVVSLDGTAPITVGEGRCAAWQVDGETLDTTNETPILAVTVDNTPVHSGPSVGYGVIGYASVQTNYEIIGRNRNSQWMQIRYHDRMGWVCAELSATNEQVESLPIVEDTPFYCHQTHESIDGTLTGVHPDNAQVIYINGIDTTYEQHIENLDRVQQAFDHRQTMGIYNATGGRIQDVGQALDDILQGSLGARLGHENAAVQSLATHIRQHQGAPIIIVAHSQGTAIASTALKLLNEEEIALDRITVYTFSSVVRRYPLGPRYFHCTFSADPIGSRQTRILLAANLVSPSARIMVEMPLGIKGGDLLEQHSLRNYLDSFSVGCPLGWASSHN